MTWERQDTGMSVETGPLTVASYNIHRGRGGDGRRRPERVAEVIREIGADVLGLQEVDWQTAVGPGGISEADYFMELPEYRALAGPNIRDQRGHYGNVLLSRLPVLWHRTHDLSVRGREPRGAVEAVLGHGGRCVRVLATHLGLATRERRLQARALADIVRRMPQMPTAILGDVNEWRIGAQSLSEVARLFEKCRQPRSYPARLPVFRLDRILARGFAATPEVEPHASPLARRASDHLPVKAGLTLRGKGR